MDDLDRLSNHEMGYVFEHLIRKFAEDSNETAGEHFTPREVIELMVNLLIAPDEDTITGAGQVINILDPACGTGGMLTTAEDHIKAINPERRGLPVRPGAQPRVVGDLRVGDAAAQPARHDRARQLVQRRRVTAAGSSTTCWPTRRSGWSGRRSRTRSRPRPSLGFAGRFGAGLPRINDGSFLFLQHMISKMKPGRRQGGSRLAIVFNGSPAVHRRGRVRRVGDPALDPGERLARGHRRAAGPALLQHRDLHVLLDPVQPEGAERCAARSSCSTPATSARRCASPSATSASRSATSRSSTSPSCTWTPLAVAADAGIRTTAR